MSENEGTTSRRTVLGAVVGAAAGGGAVATAAPASAVPTALPDESVRASARGIECVADLR